MSTIELVGEGGGSGGARVKEVRRCADVEYAGTETAEILALVQIAPRYRTCCVPGCRCVVLGIVDAFALQGESLKTDMYARCVEVATLDVVDGAKNALQVIGPVNFGALGCSCVDRKKVVAMVCPTDSPRAAFVSIGDIERRVVLTDSIVN